jgi:molybdate transport system substrate-binding protein
MSLLITAISSMATRLVLAELVQTYQQLSGHRVHLEAVGGVDAAKRVQLGELFDVVVLASDAMEKLLAAGFLKPGSLTPIVDSSMGMAVSAGSAVPDISTEDAVRQAVLSAPRICYSTGPSGTALLKLFERWGIAQQLEGRLFQAPAGVPVGSQVADGFADLGFQQLSELIFVKGLTVLTPLPAAVQITTTFSAAVSARSTQAQVALELIDFLASPQTGQAKLHYGMTPAKSL